MQINSWRCFKNYGIIRFGLMCRQKSHMAHECSGHHNRTQACLNSCISLEYYLNRHLRTQIVTSIHFLSMSIFKINFWLVPVKLEIPSYRRILTEHVHLPRPNRDNKGEKTHEDVSRTMTSFVLGSCASRSRTRHMSMLATTVARVEFPQLERQCPQKARSICRQ